MTVPRGLRRRRRVDADEIPADLAAWFAGEGELVEESAPPCLTEGQRRALEAQPPETLSRAERRALGLPVEPLRRVPWSALIYPDYLLLHERWIAWKAEHPDARPPAGHEYIEKPPVGHEAQLAEQARQMVNLGRRR